MPLTIRFLLVCAFCVLVSPALLVAQASFEEEEDDVVWLSPFVVETDEVQGYQARNLVSVGRLNVTQLETARSVTVVTSELLDDTMADDLATALKYVPGVDQNSGSWVNTLGDNVSIRGVDGGFTFRNFYRSTTIPWSVTIDRIEVVKGPSSLMYGITNPGGQINYLTKRPTFTQAGRIDLQTGRWDFAQAMVDYQDMLFADTWAGDLAFRVVGAMRLDGWWEDHADQDRRLGLLSLAWKPTERDQLIVEWEHQNFEYTPSLWVPVIDPALDYTGSLIERFTQQGKAEHGQVPFRDRGPGEEPYLVPDRYYNPLGPNHRTIRKTDVYSADYERQLFGGWSVKASYLLEDGRVDEINADHTVSDRDLTNYRRAFRFQGTQELQSANLLLFGEIPVIENMWDNRMLMGGSWYKDEFVAVRKYTSDIPGKGLVGLYEVMDFVEIASVDENQLGRDINGDGEIGLIPIPEFQGLPYNPEEFPFWSELINQRTTFENYAYWLANDFIFFDERLIVRGGVRGDEFEQVRYTRSTGDVVDAQGEQSTESYQYSALFKATENISLYYSYSESVRDQFVFAAGSVAPVVRGEGDEVGLKYSFFDGRVTGLLAYYQFTIDGKVDTANEGPGFRDLPPEEYEGFEFEVSGDLTQGLSFIASYAYVEARQIVPPEDSITGDFIEERVDNVPDHRASLWARYSFEEGPAEGLFLGLGVKNVGDRTYLRTEGPVGGVNASGPGDSAFAATFWQALYDKREAYTTVDFLIGYKWTQYDGALEHELSLKIDNVFDETYIVSRQKWGQPRNLRLAWRIDF